MPPEALAAAIEREYDRFRRYARAVVRNEDAMQATTVLHDALARIWKSDVHFDGDRQLLALVSMKLRQVVLDRVRARDAAKRGGDVARVPLDPERDAAMDEFSKLDLAALDEALGRLRADPDQDRLWRVVELRFFAGLTTKEIADVLETSESTIERDWRFAKAWLRREMGHEA